MGAASKGVYIVEKHFIWGQGLRRINVEAAKHMRKGNSSFSIRKRTPRVLQRNVLENITRYLALERGSG